MLKQNRIRRKKRSRDGGVAVLIPSTQSLFGYGSQFDILPRRLIVANARMQSHIYKILSPEQQKKLSDLERKQGAVTSDSR